MYMEREHAGSRCYSKCCIWHDSLLQLGDTVRRLSEFSRMDESKCKEHEKKQYHELLGVIGWKPAWTGPGLAFAHSFLSQFLVSPAVQDLQKHPRRCFGIWNILSSKALYIAKPNHYSRLPTLIMECVLIRIAAHSDNWSCLMALPFTGNLNCSLGLLFLPQKQSITPGEC